MLFDQVADILPPWTSLQFSRRLLKSVELTESTKPSSYLLQTCFPNISDKNSFETDDGSPHPTSFEWIFSYVKSKAIALQKENYARKL